MAGSETPRPGWWRARDGNWYPPETLPEGWFIDTDGVAKQRQPTTPPLPLTPIPSTRRDPLPIRKPTYSAPIERPGPYAAKAWRIALPAAAIVAICAAAVMALTSEDGKDQTMTDVPTTSTLEAARVSPATTVPTATTPLAAPTTAPLPTPTPPPTSTPSPTPTAPPTAPPPACSAAMSNAAPARDSVVSVLVASSQPNAPVQVTVEYRTTTLRYPGTTNASGAATIAFSVGNATIGFTVKVTVSVGPATCSTTFTTS